MFEDLLLQVSISLNNASHDSNLSESLNADDDSISALLGLYLSLSASSHSFQGFHSNNVTS